MIVRCIFGAGKYGRLLLKYFSLNEINIDYFIQTTVSEVQYVEGVKLVQLKDLDNIEAKIHVYISVKDNKLSHKIYEVLSHKNNVVSVVEYGDFICQNLDHDDFNREQIVTYGEEFQDKIFYVIRRKDKASGLFSYYRTVLSGIVKAISGGMIPIVDMQSTENIIIENNYINKINAWEYFFYQPMGYSLADVQHAKNVVLSNSSENIKNEPDSFIFDNVDSLNFWRENAHKWIRIKKEWVQKVNNKYMALSGGKPMLGVLMRGTDYMTMKPYNHPIQPRVNDVINKCKSFIDTHEHCYRIFLATEDIDIYKTFHNVFGDKMVVNQSLYFESKEKEWISDIIQNSHISLVKKNKEYFEAIMILSMCPYIIGGRTGGMIGAMLMSNGYDYQYIYNLGVYP